MDQTTQPQNQKPLTGERHSGARTRSLRLSLLRSISLVLLVTLLFGGMLTYWQAVSKIDTEVSSALAVAEKTVRKAIPEIARDDDPRLELVRLVRIFDGNRHVRATLLTPDTPAHPLVESQVAETTSVPSWFYALFAHAPEVVDIELPGPLLHLGSLKLTTERGAEVAEVWNEVLLKLAILMVFCAALCGLVYITLGRALEPLTSLTQAFERLGNGNYSARVAERGPAELAKLCAGFNDMAHRLGEMEDRNQQLNEQLATVQDEERADLARDLHDEVSPFLFSVEVDAAFIRQRADAAQVSELATRAEAIREAVAHMKKHVRSILGRLRPAMHLELGLEHAIQALVTSWRGRNPSVRFNLAITETGFGPKLDSVIHGIVREAISNALKHAKPTEIDIEVSRIEDGGVTVTVRDNGSGLDPQRSIGGFGLIAMRERVSALRGTLLTENRKDGSGVEITARLPAPAAYAGLPASLPQERTT